MPSKKKITLSFDLSLVIIPILLSIASLATLYSITAISGRSDLVLGQIVNFVIGVAAYIIFALLDYRSLKGYATYLFLFGIILLLLVDIIGETVFGSRRWISLGFTQFQPSEMMKFILLIFSAAYFSRLAKTSPKRLFIFIFLSLIPIALVLIEPDLGTSLVLICILVAAIFTSKVPPRIFILLGAIVIALSPLIWMNLKPYQKGRITSFMYPERDKLGSGYNVNQSKIAVGSGGLYGKGFSGTTQSQLQFLPVSHIDFIFSTWAEATGFIGSSFMIILYGFLIYRVFAIANMARDDFGYIYLVCFAVMIFFQSLVNVGMNIGIMPVTGIPLPLVSYGGTSVLIFSSMLGVAQSIFMRRKALRFD